MKLLGSLLAIGLMTGCSDNKIAAYENNQPPFVIEDYFSGPLVAYGMIQDWRGKVIRRFRVDMEGSWEGDVGTLKENFTYNDGRTQSREWHWKRIDPHHFTGTASDVIGSARGAQYGNVINLQYRLKIPIDNKEMTFNFDDWLYLIDNNVVINKAKMKKFGFTVAELTITFSKPAR